MKKTCLFLLTVLLLALMTSAAFAEDKTITVSEAGMTLSIPEDVFENTFSRDATEEELSSIGHTRQSWVEKLARGNFYLYGEEKGTDGKLNVFITRSIGPDYDDLTDEKILNNMSEAMNLANSAGLSAQEVGLYKAPKHTFSMMRMTMPMAGVSVTMVQYGILYQNQMILFQYESSTGFSDRTRSAMEKMLDSVELDAAKRGGVSVRVSGPNGLVITMPDGLDFHANEKIDTMPDAEGIGFTAYKPDGELMVYCVFGLDMYTQMPAALLPLMGINSRADLDEYMNHKNVIAESFDVKEEEISLLTFNGVPYFAYTDQDGLKQLFHTENGILFMFQYNGELRDSDPGYPMFVSLIESAEYPTPAVKNLDFESQSVTDAVSDTVLMLPASAVYYQEDDSIYALITSSDGSDYLLRYLQVDIFELLGANFAQLMEANNFDRSQLGFSYVDRTDAADLFEVDVNSVASAQYGDHQFWQAEDEYGAYYMTCVNGRMYYLAFIGYDDAPGNNPVEASAILANIQFAE